MVQSRGPWGYGGIGWSLHRKDRQAGRSSGATRGIRPVADQTEALSRAGHTREVPLASGFALRAPVPGCNVGPAASFLASTRREPCARLHSVPGPAVPLSTPPRARGQSRLGGASCGLKAVRENRGAVVGNRGLWNPDSATYRPWDLRQVTHFPVPRFPCLRKEEEDGICVTGLL